MFRLLVILFILSSSLYAQTDSSSIQKNYYSSGVLSSEGQMINGKPNGLWKNYYPNGQLKSYGHWSNNKLTGTWLFFDDKGDTLQSIEYRNQKKNGWNIFYKNNKPISKYLYLNDKIESFAYFYQQDTLRLVPYENGIKKGIGYTFVKHSPIELSEYRNHYRLYTIPVNQLDKNGLKRGTWITLYADKHLKEEENFKRDTLNGVYKKYNNQGAIIYYAYYTMGVKNVQKENENRTINKVLKYANGQIKQKGSYLGNEPVGLHFLYDSLGHYTHSVYYDNVHHIIGKGKINKHNARVGVWTFSDTNAVLLSKGKYKNGYRNGTWTFYFSNGKIEQEGKYKKGKLNGVWKHYYSNGAVLKVENYDKGILDGEFKQFFIDGKNYINGQYKDGKKDGKWVYSNNYLVQNKYFSDGEKTGTWTSHYFNGKLAYKGVFENNLENGKHIYYYSNGFTKASTYYMFGLKEKLWFYFDKTGQETVRLLYKNDILTKIDGKEYN